MNEKYRYLGKNTIILTLSSFGTKFLSFLLVPLYTNILSTEDYGTADILITTATLLIFVLTIDIADAVLRFTIEKKQKQEEVLSYGMRVLLVGTLWCSIGLFIVYITEMIKWEWYFYFFIFLYFFVTALYQILTNYLRGIDKIKSVAFAGIISMAGIISANLLLLIVFKFGIIGYLISLIFGPMLASIYCIFIVGKPITIYFVNICDKQTMREMCKYCFPLIFNHTALWINGFLDRYFVTAYCGVGENGIYSVASKIPTILATCYTVFFQAWSLSAIKEFDPEDKDGFFLKIYSSYNAFITIICSVLIILNIPLARFLYQKDFFEAWRCSSVLLLSVMFNSMTIMVGSIFVAVKESKTVATSTIISAIVNTILNFFMIPIFGIVGAATSTAIAYFVMWVIRLLYSRKYINIKRNFFIDCFGYMILVLQIIFEHMEGHFYFFQFLCLVAVVLLNRRILYFVVKCVAKVLLNGRKSL